MLQLSATLADPRAGIERARRFTEGFIRPQGLDEPSTPRFANAIEAVALQPAPRPGRRASRRVDRPLSPRAVAGVCPARVGDAAVPKGDSVQVPTLPAARAKSRCS